MWRCKKCGNDRYHVEALSIDADIDENGIADLGETCITTRIICSRCCNSSDQIREIAEWVEHER
ncbi:hypothetical protein IX329_000682 [Fusobacterium necrophorum]|nr:hypothetical protein [Fusobacterium necrophorum]MBR8789347.1 hypothetical protein [Fusobacterium necrophorum]